MDRDGGSARLARRSQIAMLCLCLLILSGCETVSYYAQAIAGQREVLAKSKSIEALLNDPDTEPVLQRQLKLVVALRGFAATELSLPADKQFTNYADLARDHVVWNVFAAPELEIGTLEWCYPIAGCAGYRGYFNKKRAEVYAAKLSSRGYDTWIGGVSTYSTLGWFDDPVLNTYVFRSDADLAEIIFHELAHVLLYVPGDTTFNESFATTVAREGVNRWLQSRHDEDGLIRFEKTHQQQESFNKLIEEYRSKLNTLYDSTLDDETKRANKQTLIEELRQTYLSQTGEEEGLYKHWIKSPINNAKLNAVSFYTQLVPELQLLLQQSDGDLETFYAESRKFSNRRKNNSEKR